VAQLSQQSSFAPRRRRPSSGEGRAGARARTRCRRKTKGPRRRGRAGRAGSSCCAPRLHAAAPHCMAPSASSAVLTGRTCGRRQLFATGPRPSRRRPVDSGRAALQSWRAARAKRAAAADAPGVVWGRCESGPTSAADRPESRLPASPSPATRTTRAQRARYQLKHRPRQGLHPLPPAPPRTPPPPLRCFYSSCVMKWHDNA
jgi:hypothetical protein